MKMSNKSNIAFNNKFVSSLTGASVRQLSNWDKIGLIKPSVQESCGRGTLRLYSFEDIVEVRTVMFLKNKNISLQKIKIAVDYLKDELKYKRPLKEAKLITDGNEIIITTEDVNSVYSRWVSASQYGQIIFDLTVVPLGIFVEEIENKFLKYEKRLEKGEKEYKEGKTVSLDSVREKYFGLSNRSIKRRNKRS